MTNADQQVLASIAPQIRPLPCTFDDAAEYFGDVDMSYQYVDDDKNIKLDPVVTIIEPPEVISHEDIQHERPTASASAIVRKKKNIKKKTKISAKDRYFKIKINNALIQRKQMTQKHKLEMKLLQLQIKKIEDENNAS